MTARGKQLAFGVVGLLVLAGLIMWIRSGQAPPEAAPSQGMTIGSAPPPVAAPSATIERPANTEKPDVGPVASGAPVDLGMALVAAKKVDAARSALAAGDPKRALEEIEAYQHMPEANALKQEAVVVKIEALSKVGRRSDALALAMSTRDDPSYAPYQGHIQAILADAGL
jgi:hypothetical protein